MVPNLKKIPANAPLFDQALIQGIFITAQSSVKCSLLVKRMWQKGVAIGFAKSLRTKAV